MKRSAKMKLLVLVSCLTVALAMTAVTMVPVKVKCPICGEVNDFFDYASWGSYVYSWPSKFQMVFWPHTYPTSLYICKRCHYSAWMWDFKSLKPEDVAKARDAAAAFANVPETKSYSEVPMSLRLSIAERVYQTQSRDDIFWSQFYRIAGYHFAREKKPQEAQAARMKARDLLRKLALDPKLMTQRKEYLVSLAAMDHFTGDDTAALDALAKAAKETYAEGENAKGYNSYLDALIQDYQKKIKSKTVPADDGQNPDE